MIGGRYEHRLSQAPIAASLLDGLEAASEIGGGRKVIAAQPHARAAQREARRRMDGQDAKAHECHHGVGAVCARVPDVTLAFVLEAHSMERTVVWATWWAGKRQPYQQFSHCAAQGWKAREG